MDSKDKLEDYLSKEEIKSIAESGSLVEELLDQRYDYFLWKSVEYSPEVYNHNYRYSLEKELKEISDKFIELDDHKGKILINRKLEDFDRKYKLSHLSSLSLNVCEAFELFEMDKYIHVCSLEGRKLDKASLVGYLLAIVKWPLLPWHRTHILKRALAKELKDNPQEENKSLSFYLNHQDQLEDDLSRSTRTHFGNVKMALSSIFINFHSSWYKEELLRLLPTTNGNEGQTKKLISKNAEEKKINVTHVHACLIVYLYLRSQNIDIKELKAYLPRILQNLTSDGLALLKGNIKRHDDHPLNPPENWKKMAFDILMEVRNNDNYKFTKRNVGLDTCETWLKAGKKNGCGFNLNTKKNKLSFEAYIDPIIYLSENISSVYKKSIKLEIEALSAQKINYFLGDKGI